MDNGIKLNLLGLGGVCSIALEIIRNYKKDIAVSTIYDDSIEKINKIYNNHLIKDAISNYVVSASNGTIYFNCLGNINAIKNRIYYSKLLKEKGAKTINIIHPNCFLSNEISIGVGNLICPGVIINTKASVGDENIIFSNSVIEHDSTLGNLCYVSPSVTICGKVNIEDHVYIGPNAVITAGINIGKNSIIGAGAVVLKNVPENSVFVGNPAKYLKANELWGI